MSRSSDPLQLNVGVRPPPQSTKTTMPASPASRALVAAGATLAIGLALSLVARRRGWVAKISWLAALLVPIAVAAVVYWTATGS